MKFIADLHIHSRFSRATSHQMDLEHLYIHSQMKGITVVGTGDFTHPAWFEEMSEKLIPDKEGLYRLREDIERQCDDSVPVSCRKPVRFMPVCEISNIYKKNKKTRKNHNLVFMPDLASVNLFREKLDRIGNIRSDGRPILGLDARDLLEIVLEISDQGFLVPAHIWTPWFSMLGSKSGFDSIQECFEDLTPHIFAVETGLSSDPPMNWRVSMLDGLTLISNSDAHSPAKLGREANWLDTRLSYNAIRDAIKSGDPDRFLGTFEFYPEKGKYHLDGHRKCGIRSRPSESIKRKGICPVCGKPFTMGVLYRVEALADRPEGGKPEKTHPFYSLIPLTDILSEIFQVGAGSKTVQKHYDRLLGKLGPEFDILHALPIDEIDKVGMPLLGEAIRRMRDNGIRISGGYDGEYGKVRIFEPHERQALKGQTSLFSSADIRGSNASESGFEPKKNVSAFSTSQRFETVSSDKKHTSILTGLKDYLKNLNPDQHDAVCYGSGPMLIKAGPGTGKTRTITLRMARLIEEKNVSAESILAVTFTTKAAREMRERLQSLIGSSETVPWAGTFHSLCFRILTEEIGEEIPSNPSCFILDETDRGYMIREAMHQAKQHGNSIALSAEKMLDHIVLAKQQLLGPDDSLGGIMDEAVIDEVSCVYRMYQRLLANQGLFDYEDLIYQGVRLLESDPDSCRKWKNQYPYVFVDEYQDLNYAQYRLIRVLAPGNADLCVIGDPDQSIYGFRGADAVYFHRFVTDYPTARIIELCRNYRSTDTILEASAQIILSSHEERQPTRIYSGISGIDTICVMELENEASEAVAIGKTIEKLVAGFGFHSMDFGTVDSTLEDRPLSFSDIAVLFRTRIQAKVIAEVLGKAGIPCQRAVRENLLGSREVSGVLSLMRLIENSGTYADFERAVSLSPGRPGTKTLERFKAWGFENNYGVVDAMRQAGRFPVPGMDRNRQNQLYQTIVSLESLQHRLKNESIERKLSGCVEYAGLSEIIHNDDTLSDALEHLIRLAGSSEQDIIQFLNSLSLQTDTDTWDDRVEKVSLMTLHAAKGLEFPVVFIAGCEDGLIPFQRSEKDSVDIEEERRLFYVGMTRAKQRLYLTCARKRTLYGTCRNRRISPFVSDIEQRLRQHRRSDGKRPPKDRQVQLPLF